MKIMRKALSVLLVLVLMISSPVHAAFTTNHTDKTIGEVSLGEIQDALMDYFENNSIDLRPGTQEFYNYVVDQLLSQTDRDLMKEDEYGLIHAYMAEYKVAYDDFVMCERILNSDRQGSDEFVKEIAEQNGCLVYNESQNAVEFRLGDDFFNKTINDIKEKNLQAESNPLATERVASTSTRGYSGSAAATYAHRYALNYNTEAYPTYTADCTNFVSQCLKAGGLNMNGTNSQTGVYQSTARWYCIQTVCEWHNNYCYTEYAVTTSWIRVTDFYTYMGGVANSRTVKNTISALYSSCAVGDAVQLADKTTGTPYHSIIISKRDTASAYYCGHTSNRNDRNINTLDQTNDKFILFDFT